MGLRERAAQLAERSDTSALGKLRATLSDKDRDEFDDLLFGEPHVGHTIVAKVLSEAYDCRISDKQVGEYRGKHRP